MVAIGLLSGCEGNLIFRSYQSPNEWSSPERIIFSARHGSLDTITEARIFVHSLNSKIKLDGEILDAHNEKADILDHGKHLEIILRADSVYHSTTIEFGAIRVTLPCSVITVKDLGYTDMEEAHAGF